MKRICLVRILIACVLLQGALSFSFAAKRIGPVSQYGELHAGRNAGGMGQVYGSCAAYSTSGHEVQVKGMGLFWSIEPLSAKFWNPTLITDLVKKHNVQLIRAAMGVDEDWGQGNYFTKELYYQKMMDDVVQAAIDNDIYVIIDYHSHKAHENVDNAKKFFERMAQKWGAFDNVIFDTFNEPTCVQNGNIDCADTAQSGGYLGWPAIKDYSEQVLVTIRKYSDNMVIVGTPVWSQQPDKAIGNPVVDPANNVAYSFHYYAGAHSVRGMGGEVEKAIRSGLTIFVSEWGTDHPVLKGPVSSANRLWLNWMDRNKLSSANWAFTSLVEDPGKQGGGDGQGSSYFASGFNPDKPSSEWKYSESGKWVNANVFAKLPNKYTACKEYVPEGFFVSKTLK